MDFHKETIDGLRAKNYDVGASYIKAAADGFSAHRYITVNGLHMPIEWARHESRTRDARRD